MTSYAEGSKPASALEIAEGIMLGAETKSNFKSRLKGVINKRTLISAPQ